LFILAEEVVTRAEMWHIKNELKELVTGEWVRVNPKGIAAYRQRNQINIVFSSNEHQPLPIENDDRRHCVIWTPDPVGREFYEEVREEIANGGIEAFYHHLLNLDLGDFKPWTAPPMTDAKKRLILLSLPSEHRFVNDWAEGDTEWPLVPCLASDLYAAYLRWCRLNGEQRPRPSNQFHGFVARLTGWAKKKCRVHADMTFHGPAAGRPMILPPDHLLATVGKAKPEGESIAHWLTQCYIEFQQALNKREDRWAA
jgi:putative DNA primase/helicase